MILMYRKSFFLPVALVGLIIINSCSSKSGGGGSGTPPNPCDGVTITVTGTPTNSSGAGATNGSISATASGGSGFTFSINSGAFQSSGSFTGLAAGAYTITAKDSRGCSGTTSVTISANDACAGLTFTVGGTSVSATPCLSTPNGSITVTTSGTGTGFTYNVNGGAFQSAATFNNLAANTYTVGAKESGGCVRTASVTVSATNPGAMFSAVKAILAANCALSGCHSGAAPQNGIDFSQNCQIVANSARIKARAVDNFGSGQQMPPPPSAGLSAADKTAITTWVAAGGLYSN